MRINLPGGKKLLLYFLSFLLGLIFIYSGYTKLDSIEYFELLLVESGLAGWQLTPFFARLLIGLEFFAGFLFIFSINTRRIPYTAGVALLAIFSVYLVISLINNGNTGDCGCFGDAIHMSPLAALGKNVFLAAGLLVLDRFHAGVNLKFASAIIPGSAVVLLVLPFVLYSVELGGVSTAKEKDLPSSSINLLYSSAINSPPELELREGKWLVAFLSLKCRYCKLAARKIALLKKENPDLPVYFVLNGDKEGLPEFLAETKSENVPHVLFIGSDFAEMSGYRLPVIYFTDKGTITHTGKYSALTADEINQLLLKD